MDVTSIINYSETHLKVTNEGTDLFIKKAYVEVSINPDSPDIVVFKFHWYEINPGPRLFYLDYNRITNPSEVSAAALLATLQGYLITQNNKGIIYVDQKPKGTGSTFGTITGNIDGSNKTFNCSQGVYAVGKILVYYNGNLSTQGTDKDYFESDSTTGEIQFVFVPASDSTITFQYQIP